MRCKPFVTCLLRTVPAGRRALGFWFVAAMLLFAVPLAAQESTQPDSASPPRSLFDGRTLKGWQVPRFGGDGEVVVEDGVIVLSAGDPLTGITFDGQDLPTNNYEIAWEAKRLQGIDFFSCLTFPVDDSHCSFVVGGWAGTVVGLSSLDQQDASRNETKSQHKFENDRWYRLRVRVNPGRIQCWLDDEQVVDAQTEGRAISIRNEVTLNRPLGLCTFQTKAAIRQITLKTDIDADGQPSNREP